MGHASFGVMWPRRNPNIVTLVRKDGLRLPIHKELSELVSILMDLTEALGYNIIPGHTWGYANRAIRGTNQPSNHSQGTSVDINAPANPMASRDWHARNNRKQQAFGLDIVTNIPENIVRLWTGHGFGWGGFYKNRPDPMHFEFNGSVDQARQYVRNLKSFLKNVKPVPHKPAPARPPKPGGNWAWLDRLLDEIIAGKWGNGERRVARLRAAGFNDAAIRAIQAAVNKRLRG